MGVFQVLEIFWWYKIIYVGSILDNCTLWVHISEAKQLRTSRTEVALTGTQNTGNNIWNERPSIASMLRTKLVCHPPAGAAYQQETCSTIRKRSLFPLKVDRWRFPTKWIYHCLQLLERHLIKAFLIPACISPYLNVLQKFQYVRGSKRIFEVKMPTFNHSACANSPWRAMVTEVTTIWNREALTLSKYSL